ncbi:MAG TPA: aminotransferase class V-fold PLP-dependent enzyme [Chloroflexi bacterium]|nr:aminotransferase class V-fold PLP-dependent enzyme [Chloroflexota bacterium]
MNQTAPPLLEELTPAQAAFEAAYPDFSATRALDDLRAQEYARLDRLDHVYLDYTGGGLYADCQLHEHHALLSGNVFGNPHSRNPTSLAMTERVERARAYVLEYFNAPPEEYEAIFTLNASGALKLVGEAYPFEPGGHYTLTFDNHNSVNGIREFARAKGATITYAPVTAPELRVDMAQLEAALAQAQPGKHNLFAFPAQSNYSGVQHPLTLIEKAQAQGWDVLLDSAAFAPTNRLDVHRWRPDFVALSFYKMFGYPTGVGCLLARREALAKLRRPWYAGGTISIASVQGDGHYFSEGAAGFEDGTVDYLNLPAVEIGLRHLAHIGIEQIHERVLALTGWLLAQLTALHHSNGRPLVSIHGPTDLTARGGTVTGVFLDRNGAVLDERRIEELANRRNISLRTGCFCNPGAGEVAHGLTPEVMRAFFTGELGLSFAELRDKMQQQYGKHVGAVRISVGMVSNFADVYRLVNFARSFLDRTNADIGPFGGPDHTCG